MDIILLDTINV